VSDAPSVTTPDDPATGTTRSSETDGPLHPQPASPLPDESAGKGRSETLTRFLTAAVLVPAVLWVIVQGGLVYLGVVIAFVVLAQREFYHLIEEKGARPLWSLGLGAGAALPVVAYMGNEYHVTILMTASLLALMVAQLRKRNITESLASLSGTFFGVVYVGWLLSHIVVLRRFQDAALARFDASEVAAAGLVPGAGIFFVIFTLTVVVNCDAGAYFAGRAYGRHKLAPRISPGKSVEGAIGGILWGTAAGLICKAVFDQYWPQLSQSLGYAVLAGFGVVLAVAGIVGDLVESLLKRDAAMKDAGSLLPGMGGVLDRIDEPLLAVPIMHYMLLGYFFLRLN
jgi:phosphatidate cytidylyltransferase